MKDLLRKCLEKLDEKEYSTPGMEKHWTYLPLEIIPYIKVRPQTEWNANLEILKILQKLISNSRGKHKANQYHDGDFIPDKTYWRQKEY